MSWIRDGHNVKASYIGNIVTGTVTDSRVKYGGAVQYTVKLDNPIEIYGRIADHLLIDNDDLINDYTSKTKFVKNLMSGKIAEIEEDTPWCCNPASETFWSM